MPESQIQPREREREYITIDEGKVSIKRESTVRTISEDDFLRAIRNKDLMDTGILPFGTVAYGKRGVMQHYLIWRPERKGMFEFKSRLGEEKRAEMLELAWPCHVFGFKFQKTSFVGAFLWFAKGPIRTTEDILYYAPLPNQNGSASLCLGDAHIREIKPDNPIITSENTVRYIYESSFNEDLSQSIPSPPEFGIGLGAKAIDVLRAWARWTKDAGEDWRVKVNAIDWQKPLRVEAARKGLL